MLLYYQLQILAELRNQIKIILSMSKENPNFFTTQIPQQSPEKKEPPLQEQPIKNIEKQKQIEQQNLYDELTSLKNLLNAFNSFDVNQRGVISLEEAIKILEEKNVPTDKFQLYYKLSLPVQKDVIAFDQFLFVFGLCENISVSIEDKYHLCRSVDKRLIEFLRLLNNYRKKSQQQLHYKDAKKSKSKIQEIRERELERRKNYLNILHDHEILELEEKQKAHFMDFCNKWDDFMMDYEKTAADLIQKLQSKHEAQIVEFIEKTREELSTKIHYSKYILQLSTKQKNLVKLQEYEQANVIHEQIQKMKQQQVKKKLQSDEQIIKIRCAGLKKQQVISVNNLLQNIQKDRNDQMKQRKTDSQKLIVRNRTMITEINHKHAESIKKIYEALHNISLENSK